MSRYAMVRRQRKQRSRQGQEASHQAEPFQAIAFGKPEEEAEPT
jgi:hypothetical protein